MKLIHVAAAALNQTPLDWEGNRARILEAIRLAREQQVSVLCLPELCISGYGCEDAFFSSGVQEIAIDVLLELVPETKGMLVAFGLPVGYGGGLFDAAALAADGEILGVVCKQNLAGDGIHYEPRWFQPWPEGEHGSVSLGGKVYPLGDLVFDCGGVGIGFEICEDAWVGDRPGADLAREGADILLNPSASHFAFGKQEIRRRFVLEGSRAFHVSYIYTNLVGNEAGRAIYDGGSMIASGGQMLAEANRFSYRGVHLTRAVIDIEMTRMQRARTHGFHRTRGKCRKVEADFEFPSSPPRPASSKLPAWDKSEWNKEEEFSRAVPLALFDYLRKSKSGGFAVSLSGGADSSAVAVLVWLMVRLGVEELGFEAFKEKLAHIARLSDAGNQKELVHRLLACVYQSTRNSSDTTRHAARTVATSLGAEFLEFDVDEICQKYVETVSQAIGRELTWEQDDIALQNIQARVRSPGIWLLANLRGALLLATSNRSEAAVGYATMDGDTSGGLSPIAGIDKAFLRQWLRWMQDKGPAELEALPMLEVVTAQQPTAELRPASAGQTDEEDLMPYEVLDAIERAAIRDKRMPVQIFHLMHSQFPQYAAEQMGAWVERFFRLWCRNQWKRERYAPVFHLDDENLDPKTWCRFPILSGGYRRELARLREVLEEVAQQEE